MTNSVTLNDQGIIEVQVVGDQTYTSVVSMGRQISSLLEKQSLDNKPLLILDDITRLTGSTIAARKAVAELVRTLPFERGALLGDGSIFMRVGTTLLLRTVTKHNKNVRYFDKRDAAIKWLLQRP